jgi:sugar fermentation stimulation protein A
VIASPPLRFGPFRKAVFLERPNRFLLRARVKGRGAVEAFLPNPGRLHELLLPGTVVYLAADPPAPSGTRKTSHTVLAVERDGTPIFLHTHRTNDVARHLIERRRIPGLERAEVVRAEVPVGRSRFDFLLREKGREVLLEVKSCTLFGGEGAMFPDAVTERGRRHLLELAERPRGEGKPVVLFLVHSPKPRWFLPDYHTDLAFSRTLLDVRGKLRILPVSVSWNPDLSLGDEVRRLEIPWTFLGREARDRGSYLLVLRLNAPRRIDVGSLGSLRFAPGHYLYVGSAMKNLASRIARHLGKRKRIHWHVDALRARADAATALPIRGSRRRECEIASALAGLFAAGPRGFGASDCACATHLFHAPSDPLHDRAFHEILQGFRFAGPGL